MKKYLNKTNFKYPIALIAVLVLLIGCEDSNVRDGIRAITLKPTANLTIINIGEVITYTDSSQNVASRLWTFEGGSIASSSDEVVDVTYDTEGTFSTEIEITDSDGNVKDHNFNVEVFPLIVPEFSTSANSALMGSEITFTNNSLNTESAFETQDEDIEDDSFFWEFEGGVPATSSEKDPVVRYPNVGTYDVKLTIYRRAPEHKAIITKQDFINIVDTQVISPTVTRLAELGSKIHLTYDVPVGTVDADAFSVSIDGADATAVAGVATHGSDPNTLVVSLTTAVTEGQTVNLSYNGSDFAPSGELLGSISALLIENTIMNLLKDQNPGFEDDAAGGFPTLWGNWDGENNRNNPEVYELIDTDQHSGSNSLQVALNTGISNDWSLETPHVAIVEGATYRLSVWAKASEAGIPLDFRSVAEGWASSSGKEVSLTTEWVKYEAEFTTTDDLGRNYWHVLRPNDSPNGSFVYLDDVSLYRID